VFDSDYTARDHDFRDDDHYARAKYELTLRWLGAPGSPPRRLVNIGCGAGLFNRLASEAGFVVEACEPEPSAHAVAAAAAPAGVTVYLGGLYDAPIAPGADVVVMHDVLEHIQDDRPAVNQLARLVAPNGRLVLSVPALQALFGLHDELLGHFRRYDRKSLADVLVPRFSIDRMRYFGLTFIPITAWYSRWRRKPYPTSAAGGTSVVGRAFDLACRAEGRVAVPLGTSLVVEARPRQPSS
jgi:SAM-dependent methyltransferase